MSRMKWGAKAVAVVAASALALSACGGGTEDPTGTDAGAGTDTATDAPAAEGGTLTAAAAYTTTNFHPSSTSSALAMGSNWHVVEGLWELDLTTYEPFKALAATDDLVEVTETQYEVALRDGAAFSDGTPVTAEDVATSFDRATAEGNIYAPMLSFITSIEAKDETTVTINTEFPTALLKQRLTLIKIVPASATDEDLTAMPIGTGPWAYSAITEQSVSFTPNENYNGDFPATADNMEWQILVDDTARTTAMQQGTVSVMESVPADAAALIEGSGAIVEAVQGFNLPFLMFNTKKAPFDDAKVRQAFFYAIDTQKLIDNALSGNATPARSFLPETHPNFNEASTVFTYDPEMSKSLLAEAGVSNLSLTLLTTDHPWITALSPQIKNDLEAVGLSVEIQSLASSALYADNTDVDDPQFDVVLAPGDPSVFGNDPDLLMRWWYGDNSWTQKRTQWGGSEGYTALHELLDAAVRTSGDEQQDLWNQSFDLLSEEVPLYPLFHRMVVTAYNPAQITGFSPIGTTGLNLVRSSAVAGN